MQELTSRCLCEQPYNTSGLINDGTGKYGYSLCPVCHGRTAIQPGKRIPNHPRSRQALAEFGIIPISRLHVLWLRIRHWVWWKYAVAHSWWNWHVTVLFENDRNRQMRQLLCGTWVVSPIKTKDDDSV